jgi:hypothetical protein
MLLSVPMPGGRTVRVFVLSGAQLDRCRPADAAALGCCCVQAGAVAFPIVGGVWVGADERRLAQVRALGPLSVGEGASLSIEGAAGQVRGLRAS